MINRILIRIKVVQMLYSYLLTRSEFRIEAAPEKKTRDSIYAYRLYLDLLLLILKLSGQKVIASDRTLPLLDKSGKNPLANSAIAKSLASLSELREHASKNPDYLEDFSAAISDIHAEIVESSVFKDYAKKRKREINDDLNLWATLLETVVEKNKKFEATCRESADFTLAGYRRAFQMAIATLRDYTDTRSSLVNARKSLDASLEQAHLLYYALLWLPVELTRMEAQNLDAAKEK